MAVMARYHISKDAKQNTVQPPGTSEDKPPVDVFSVSLDWNDKRSENYRDTEPFMIEIKYKLPGDGRTNPYGKHSQHIQDTIREKLRDRGFKTLRFENPLLGKFGGDRYEVFEMYIPVSSKADKDDVSTVLQAALKDVVDSITPKSMAEATVSRRAGSRQTPHGRT